MNCYEQICKISVLWGHSSLFSSQSCNQKSHTKITPLCTTKAFVSWWKWWTTKSVCGVCVLTQDRQCFEFFSHSQGAVFHTNKQKGTIVMCTLTARNHILSNMQDCVHQLMQLIQFWNIGNFETTITNSFIRHDVSLDTISWNGYESMGFDIKQLTQDTKQDLLIITTNYHIPLAQYHDHYSWAKYAHRFLTSMFSLNARQNSQLHSTYHNALRPAVASHWFRWKPFYILESSNRS